tara:strand:- start:38 stop:400 length:363 start_codon:yes stop_codon:yes gene_type:complete
MIVITPALAAAGLGVVNTGLGLFGQSQQRRGASEAMGFQADMLKFQGEQGADQLAAQFGMGQMGADADYNRQLRGSIDSLNLMNSAPYINNMTRTAGFQLAGRGMAPDQVARFTQMFGGS